MRDYDKVASLELVQEGKVSTVRHYEEDGVVIHVSGRMRTSYLMHKAPTAVEMLQWLTNCVVPHGGVSVRHYIADHSHEAKRFCDALIFPNGVRLCIYPESDHIDLYITKGDTYLEEFTVTPRHPVTTLDDAIAELAHQGIL